jgi:hypothetical protein
MCTQSQRYSRIKHSLLSAYGSKWIDRNPIMFTVYIDDSGSSPEHKIAVASAIVIPARSIVAFEGEWDKFLEKEGIPEFHSSECLARNSRSAFAGWDEQRVRRAFDRVRQITIKYSVQAFCIAIHKQDYSEVMPEDMLKRVGSFYTWAVSSVLGLAYDWAEERSVPIEYVFDTADKMIKREIDEAMEYSEALYPGHFAGHYSFRNRKEVPALQAVDLFAWTCYQAARHTRFNEPISEIAHDCWDGYRSAKHERWAMVQSLNREGLENWVKESYSSPSDLQLKEFKQKRKAARMPKPKSPLRLA